MLAVKRVYDPVTAADGKRYLVDRLWPRGLAKEAARLDGWLKDLAPSTALRQWFGHDPDKWREFQRRYREELARPEAVGMLVDLGQEIANGPVTLLYGSRNREFNHAQVLKEVLTGR